MRGHVGMLDKKKLVQLLDRLGVPPKGRELIERARAEAPVRKVESRGSNVITLYASRKMGCEIRTESRHIEFASAVSKEYDPTVLEYYAQPCLLRLDLVDADGEIHSIQHTPDFLVIREDGITLEEWKTEEKLKKLALRYPYRFQRNDDGGWYSKGIEAHLAQLGIQYKIFNEHAIPGKRIENFLHLADYFHPAAEACPMDTLDRLQAVLKEQGSVSLHELMAAPHNFVADELNKAIADGLVVVNLDNQPLTQPRRAFLYRDETFRDFVTAEVQSRQMPGHEKFVIDIAPGTVIDYERTEMTITLVSEKDFVCNTSDGRTITFEKEWLIRGVSNGGVRIVKGMNPAPPALNGYTEKQLSIAISRRAEIKAETPRVSGRSIRRWKKSQKDVKLNGGSEYAALIPRFDSRGNRTGRLTDEQKDVLSHVIETVWISHQAVNYKAAYRVLCNESDSRGVKPVSYPTFIKTIKAAQDNHTLRSRHGKRMAYQLSEFHSVLHVDTPPHGSRPFQYVHIDHTQLDIELVSSKTVPKPLGRPWLSFAIDAFSRRILAIYLTFDPPSYHAVMMVVRDMVKRHSRLPEFIVVDNGAEFRSKAFENYLEFMGVHLRFRPAGQPRHGAVLERVFGRLNTEYVHNLAGNTKATKNVRMTTGKHLPVNFAEWTLESMYHGINFWAYDYYDHEVHPALDASPLEMFQEGIRQSGSRPNRVVLFNDDFKIFTCPLVDRDGVRQVHNQRGVKVNGFLYWHPDFRDPRYAGQKWQVRYDPWDASTVFVRLKDRWVHAQCRSLMGLGQLTELERRAMTEEFIAKTGGQIEDERTRQRLREFMKVFTPKGALEAAFERQQENKALYNQLQLSCLDIRPEATRTYLNKEIATVQKVDTDVRDNRSTSHQSVPALYQEGALEDLPDFDTF